MHSTRPRGFAAALASLALAAPMVAVAAAPAIAAPLPSVVLNEVLQNNALPDQIELLNTGTDPVDVSGWIVKDDNDARTFALADGTSIAPGGYLSVLVDEGPTGFGLGKADMVRVYAADGATLVDSFEWDGHQTTSYGRCPDGTGDFVVTPVATPGAANACEAPAAGNIVINEIESSNGVPGDWIELMNTGIAPVAVGGLIVRDNNDANSYTLPAGTLNPGAFLLLHEADFGFGLGGADSVRLFEGTTVIDQYSWTTHAGTTYGRCPDGVGPFQTTATSTPGAANDCVAPAVPQIAINEVETNNGDPGDWIELFNYGAVDVDLSGYHVLDNDDTHAPSIIPAGTIIPAGGFYVVEEAALGFGLGKEDSARLFLPGGHTLVAEYSWTAAPGDAHAPTTFGRCPDGTGPWQITTASTKGAANDCSNPVRINEIESSGGTPGDWVELVNAGYDTVAIGGLIVRDNDDTHTHTIATGLELAPGAYHVIEEAALGFGLGGADSVRLFETDGTTLIDSYTWTAHAGVTYGRCPDGTGDFANTKAATKGAVNSCEGDLETSPWPGASTVTIADVANTFGSDMSGLAFDGEVLWAVNNGNGTLHRLVQVDGLWVNDPSNGWAAGKTLRYPDGLGTVDAEGVAVTTDGAAAGVYVASERNTGTGASGSRPSVLKYDVSAAGSELIAVAEWNFASDLPTIGANAGLEGIAWIPDAALRAQGFIDPATGLVYDPTDYPSHGEGLFVIGVEGSSLVYLYALDAGGTDFVRVAAFESGFHGVMELEYDLATGLLYVICDDACDGRMNVFEIAQSGADAGAFVSRVVIERPAGMPNLANEGFAIAPIAECIDGARVVLWADDSQTGGHALRAGSIDCVAVPGGGGGDDGDGEDDGSGDEGSGDEGSGEGEGDGTGEGEGEGTGSGDGTGLPGTDITNPGIGSTPVAPASSTLTAATRGNVSAPASALTGSSIVITVGTSHAGQSVEVWLFSEPKHLGTVTVRADGTVQVALPASVEPGAHRVAVVASNGELIGWAPITLQAAANRLAVTGANDMTATVLGAGLLLGLGGAGLVLGRRRQAAGRSSM